MALQILSTSSLQNQPSAGASPALCSHTPRARFAILRAPGPILEFVRSVGLLRTIPRARSSASSHRLPLPPAVAVPPDPRLPIIDSRSYGVSSRNFSHVHAWGFLRPGPPMLSSSLPARPFRPFRSTLPHSHAPRPSAIPDSRFPIPERMGFPSAAAVSPLTSHLSPPGRR
jgi:hypothetical protein